MAAPSNKYAGKCSECSKAVAAGAGFLGGKVDGRWTIVCSPCKTGATSVPAAPVVPTNTFPLTDEQQAVVRLFSEGDSIAVQAGAGTGKTSTLVAIAKSTSRIGQYVAFNKAIVTDAAIKFAGTNCSAATAHALAYRQVGYLYKERLDGKRQTSSEIARKLNIEPFYYTVNDEQKVIQPGTLAGYVTKAVSNFCNSAATNISARFISHIEGLDDVVLAAVRDHLTVAVRTAWNDITSKRGTLRFNPDHFLKIWELGIHGAPSIPGDYILFDEAQDASPVLLSVVEQQNRQVVFVGDAQQAIYEWRGAVDALDTVASDATAFLTNSFRFGPEIASVANAVLSTIPSAQLRLVGRGDAGAVEAAPEPDAILTRTNAGAIGVVLEALDHGKSVHLVGGGSEIESFAKAARKLIAGESVDHPELSIFSSWSEVQDYVKSDPNGSDFALFVKLIDDNGVDVILRAVSNTVSEEDADLVVTTAHKSKGREWDNVRINGDFPEREDDSERRLLYVAVTRARKVLDIESCSVALKVTGRF